MVVQHFGVTLGKYSTFPVCLSLDILNLEDSPYDPTRCYLIFPFNLCNWH